jgi:ABC-type antimicrobial peptide transport system permease subunit
MARKRKSWSDNLVEAIFMMLIGGLFAYVGHLLTSKYLAVNIWPGPISVEGPWYPVNLVILGVLITGGLTALLSLLELLVLAACWRELVVAISQSRFETLRCAE